MRTHFATDTHPVHHCTDAVICGHAAQKEVGRGMQSRHDRHGQCLVMKAIDCTTE